MRYSWPPLIFTQRKFTEGDDHERVAETRDHRESEAGMEVTSYLPAELDRA